MILNTWPALHSKYRLCVHRKRRLHRLNARIARLQAQNQPWTALAEKRLRLARVTAFEIALATQREKHWWRDLSFVLDSTDVVR